MILWFVLALASTELEIEQGYIELDRGQAAAAMDRARRGIEGDPAAVRLYLDAAAARGLGPRAVAETKGRDAALAWDGVADGLRGLVRGDDDAAVKAEAQRIQYTWPLHPELLVALWDPSASKRTVKLRSYVMDRVPSDPVAQARLLRMLEGVNVDDPALREAVLAAVDPDPPLPLATDVELHDFARGVMEKGQAIPDLSRDQRENVMRRAHAMYLSAGRGQEAASMWAAEPDGWARAFAAEALAAAGDGAGAVAALDRGAAALGRPASRDATGLDPDRIAADAAALYERRSRIAEADSPAVAWLDAVVASCLRGEVIASPASPAAAASMERAYPGSDPLKAALAAAEAAPDLPTAEGHLRAALVIVAARKDRLSAAVADAESTLAALGDVWRAGAAVASRHVGDDRLSEWGAMAVAVGRADAGTYLALASMYEREGSADARFHALAMARGLGAPVSDDVLRASFPGLGDAVLVANAVGGEPPPAAPAVVEAPPRTSGRRGAAPRAGAPATGSSPAGVAKLESPVPPWSAQVPGGTISAEALKGRMVVLSLFRSDYAPCVEQLPELGSLARRYRERGYDVVHVAISADADRADFDDLYRVGERWGQLAHAPDVHAVFGVRRVPTTWVIDRHGVARYVVDHRVSPNEIAAVLERIAIE